MFAVCESCFGLGSSTPIPAIALQQQLDSSCDLVQPVSIADHGNYISLIIFNTHEEVFSPELGKNDRVIISNDSSKSLKKSLQKSGFQVVQNSSVQDGAPNVVRNNETAQCPTSEQAISTARQDRQRRREEVQSTLHQMGRDGVTPARPVASSPSTDIGQHSGSQQMGKPSNTSSTQPKGEVLLSVELAADGSVVGVKVLRSLAADTDNAVIESVRKQKYIPAMKDGLPVPCVFDISINVK